MAEADSIIQRILLRLDGLEQTPYACSRWVQLNGGTTNLVYRGALCRPLEHRNGSAMTTQNTIILKHAPANVPGNGNLRLDVVRSEFEEAMLRALIDFSHTNETTDTVVKSPHLYLFDRDTNIQISEDLHDTTDLKTILHSSRSISTYPGGSSTLLGQSLGSWLRSFHLWSSAPAQAALRITVERNEGMVKLKRQITYDSFLEILELYPQVVEGHVEMLQAVKDTMTADFELGNLPRDGDEDWGLIHGDFWSGNVLLPNITNQDLNRLFIIDWEFAQLGHRAIDVGGMIADLYERKHFRDVDAVMPAIRGFVEGYGQVSDEMAFRTAIHAGVHLICWHIRRNPNLPLPAPPDKVIPALKLGRDWILKGWEKDRRWFGSSMFAPLFA